MVYMQTDEIRQLVVEINNPNFGVVGTMLFAYAADRSTAAATQATNKVPQIHLILVYHVDFDIIRTHEDKQPRLQPIIEGINQQGYRVIVCPADCPPVADLARFGEWIAKRQRMWQLIRQLSEKT